MQECKIDFGGVGRGAQLSERVKWAVSHDHRPLRISTTADFCQQANKSPNKPATKSPNHLGRGL